MKKNAKKKRYDAKQDKKIKKNIPVAKPTNVYILCFISDIVKIITNSLLNI